MRIKMKKGLLLILSILLVVVLASGLTGCSDENSTNQKLPTSQVEDETLKVEPINLSMKLPLNWTVASQEEMEQYYQLDSGVLNTEKAQKQLDDGKLDFYPLSVSTFSKDMPVGTIEVWIKKTDKSLEDFIKAEQKDIKEQYPDSTFSEIKGTGIGGEKGSSMTQTAVTNGMTETKDYLYLQDGDYVLGFVGSSVDKAIQDMINESFDSIKIE